MQELNHASTERDCKSFKNLKFLPSRYDEIVKGLTPFLKSAGYNPKKDLTFIPISALHGHNVRDKATAEVCPWYDGPTLFEALDKVEAPEQ